MTRPWLLQLGPWFYPVCAREELAMTRHNLSPSQYCDVIWAERYLDIKRTKPRSKSWPKTQRTKNGYALLQPSSNITPIKRARKV